MTAPRGLAAVHVLRRRGSHPPLLLVAAPDVNALGYVALARALGAAEGATVVQARAFEGRRLAREHGPEELRALTLACLEAARAAEPRGPYFLAGMCRGAHLAFEVARALEAQGERVALLAMIDTWPVENTANYALVRLEQLRYRWRAASPRERLELLARRARGLVSGLVGAGGSERRERREADEEQRVWRARAFPGRDFVPPRYGGRITVLRTARQPYWRIRDEALGWRERTPWPVELHVVPGEHGTLLRQPHVAAVAATLTACLQAGRAASRAPAAAAAVATRGSHP